MLFVVVKQNGAVIAKEAYGGDTSGVQASLNQRAANDPTLTFDVFDDSQEALFDAIQLAASPQAPVLAQPGQPATAQSAVVQTNWQTAKAAGTGAALTFIGQQLGFE